MLYIIFGVMLLAALAVVLWPLYRSERSFSVRAIGIVIAMIGLSGVTYYQIGQPEAQFVDTAAQASVDDMVGSLAERLKADPDDVDGWKMLGRSYTVMRRFEDAVTALERAVELEDSADGQTLADLGEAVFLNDNNELNGRAAQLFESSLALVPGNPKALFYSGLAAANRGDTALAADRWEALLATSPPPEIESTLRQRIAEWRGEAPPAQPAPQPVVDRPDGDVSVTVAVTLGAAARDIDPKTTVFVIARDPNQPAPPIAVARRLAEELPAEVTLTDANAMLPGRPLSAFSTLEIIVRASASGQPMAQPGDWFGSELLSLDTTDRVAVEINEQVR
jgi:cytochrome c-type biogenesis protein CcmH